MIGSGHSSRRGSRGGVADRSEMRRMPSHPAVAPLCEAPLRYECRAHLRAAPLKSSDRLPDRADIQDGRRPVAATCLCGDDSPAEPCARRRSINRRQVARWSATGRQKLVLNSERANQGADSAASELEKRAVTGGREKSQVPRSDHARGFEQEPCRFWSRAKNRPGRAESREASES
jgi:hypothetical protein